MKQGHDHIKTFTAEDISRYVRGEMSHADMHAIEMAALNDPFLADAIEGFSVADATHGNAAIQDVHNELGQALDSRINKNNNDRKAVVPFRRWQVAAAAAVLISAGILGYQSYRDRSQKMQLTATETRSSSATKGLPEENALADSAGTQRGKTAAELAKREEPAKREESASQANALLNEESENKNSEATASANKTPPVTIEEADKSAVEKDMLTLKKGKSTSDKERSATAEERSATENNKLPTDKARSAIENDDLASGKPDAALRSSPRSEKEGQLRPPSPLKNNNAALKKEVAARDAYDTINGAPGVDGNQQLSGVVAGVSPGAKEVSVATTKGKAASGSKLNTFTGQLLTTENKPLSNALIKIADDGKGYFTDNNGNFSVTSPDSMVVIDVNTIGYEPTRIVLQKYNDPKKYLLPERVGELNEVVVIGYGSKQRKTETANGRPVIKSQAQPDGGWRHFEEYVKANKDSTLYVPDDGETDVAFTVSPDGELSGFRILRSISTLADKEAVRLLKQGPRWKGHAGRKARGFVTIKL